MPRVLTVEEEARKAQIEAAMKEAAPELAQMAAVNPAAVELVAQWVEKYFMRAGYTALCRELRKYR